MQGALVIIWLKEPTAQVRRFAGTRALGSKEQGPINGQAREWSEAQRAIRHNDNIVGKSSSNPVAVVTSWFKAFVLAESGTERESQSS